MSNFILNNFKDDKYHYIFIIHICRNFNKYYKEKIYTLPDINPTINQIFIDNLNRNNKIQLNDLISKNIKELLEEKKEELKLEEEFNKTLKNTLIKELIDKDLDDDTVNISGLVALIGQSKLDPLSFSINSLRIFLLIKYLSYIFIDKLLDIYAGI